MIDALRELLQDFSLSESSDQQAELEAEIWERFGAERSVLIWDMSGFSLLTRRHGIVHYLSMVRRMQEVTGPIVSDQGGTIVKFEADNGFAEFPNPESAIQAAIEMNQAFKIENTRFPDKFDIRVSCGVDHGRILLFEGHDFYGDAVNVASKLGEDIASAGEILVAEAAMKALPSKADFEKELVSFTISGLKLNAAQIKIPEPES